MKIYTRAGDAGETSLIGGTRVAKSHARVEACGALDELNACLGRVAGATTDASLAHRVRVIQSRLFDLGAAVASTGSATRTPASAEPTIEWARVLEDDIDRMDESLPRLANFILPGGAVAAVELHVARTVCRRAERRIVGAIEGGESIAPEAVRFLNRLGDWLFVAARYANRAAGVPDVPWRPDERRTFTPPPSVT